MYPTGPAAYDRTITVFSPDGRLFQVEYAREAVKRGTTAVGIAYDKGVLLAVDRNIITPLIVPKSVEKIFKIDEHVGVATSGLVADSRRLIDDARIFAQRSRIAYGEPITVSKLTKEICDIKQAYTMYGGARPFGTAMIVAGVNDRPHIFETDPSGAFMEYTATAIGMGKRDVEKVFEEKYKEGISRDQAIDLAMIGLNTVSEGKLVKENIDVVTIELGKNYSRATVDEIGKSLVRVSKDLKAKGAKGQDKETKE